MTTPPSSFVGPDSVPLQEAVQLLSSPLGPGLGFDRVETIHGNTYQDQSTILVIPSREPCIHHKVMSSLLGLMAPMNQKRAILMCIGDEVGIAYNKLIKEILSNKDLSSWKYIMTVESDNVPPPDAQLRLLATLDKGGYDAVSGIYFTKGGYNMPMAYGDPARFAATGELEFTPRDVRSALAAGQVMEVNGIAMGCAVWRMDLFREIPEPWFCTVAETVDGAPQAFTQDLYFCRVAKLRGYRFAVDLGVKVGHLDVNTGVMY